jgi:hypothetical protein
MVGSCLESLSLVEWERYQHLRQKKNYWCGPTYDGWLSGSEVEHPEVRPIDFRGSVRQSQISNALETEQQNPLAKLPGDEIPNGSALLL